MEGRHADHHAGLRERRRSLRRCVETVGGGERGGCSRTLHRDCVRVDGSSLGCPVIMKH